MIGLNLMPMPVGSVVHVKSFRYVGRAILIALRGQSNEAADRGVPLPH
jgi:hypothetical protein